MLLAKDIRNTLSENQELAVSAAEMLKSVAHPIRLRIIAILCQGEEHVTALAERLDVAQAIISQQLRILRMNGLVSVTRDSGFAFYSIAEPRLKDFVRCVEGCSIS